MKRILFPLFISILIGSCTTSGLRVVQINNAIDSLGTVFAPDPRTAVFNITALDSDGTIILRGETDNPAAKASLITEAGKRAKVPVIDSIVLLPETSLGDSVYGIVDVSVGNIYHSPKYESEMVCQLLLGQTVKVLKKHHGWLFVQSADRYLGWAQPAIILRVDSSELASYRSKRKLIVTSIFSTLHSKPDQQGATVSDAVMADLLLPIRRAGTSFKVQLPDGRIGYIAAKDVEYRDKYLAEHEPSAKGIERIAMKMVGFPYLWGGTSTKGVDCSGFTKTVFRMNGIRLPRDASQQVHVGHDVAPGPNFENLKKGDLLFFGKKAENGKPEKIVHVAIYLGNGYFIQSADRVQISGLLKSDTAFDEYELDRFVRAKRVLPPSENLLEKISDN